MRLNFSRAHSASLRSDHFDTYTHTHCLLRNGRTYSICAPLHVQICQEMQRVSGHDTAATHDPYVLAAMGTCRLQCNPKSISSSCGQTRKSISVVAIVGFSLSFFLSFYLSCFSLRASSFCAHVHNMEFDAAKQIVRLFRNTRSSRSLMLRLFYCIHSLQVAAGACYVGWCVCAGSQPFLVSAIVRHLQDENADTDRGAWLAFALFVSTLWFVVLLLTLSIASPGLRCSTNKATAASINSFLSVVSYFLLSV